MEKLKKKNWLKVAVLLVIAVLFFVYTGNDRSAETAETKAALSLVEAVREKESLQQENPTELPVISQDPVTVDEDGTYSDKEHVAMYIHKYEKLPSNYITKTKAKARGWDQYEGNLWDVLPGMSIGGGPYQNLEGLLPEKDGREYKECDINYDGGKRGDDRIVYSNDGLVYFTGDHYESFELLYGKP